MANTTPLVTTVTKPANNLREANTAPRVNIQELCEEYYEDILPIIMEKVRHERRKDVHTRLDFGEVVEKASATLENHTVILSPTPIVTKAVITIQREETGLRHPACREAIKATKSTSSRKTRMPNNIKTYDGTGNPEDHVKVFQAAAQVERWAMPTWCHMFNSTLIGAARKKYVKDPVEIHNIKQRDGETIEDFMKRFKIEIGRIKGAPECMRIYRFMHGINNLELTKRLNEHVPKTMEEMMIATTTFIRGEAATASKKKGHVTPKEILAAEANKFQSPPPMVTPVEKRNSNKFYDFYNDKGHSTDECMQLKKQIEELVREGKLSHLIKEIKQGREQPKTGRKEAVAKDNPTTIYMSQMVPATTSLTGFSDETTWPLGQLKLLVTIGDATHSTKAWMNFMVVKSLSPYNGIIGRPGLKAIQAVPSTVREMLKFLTEGGGILLLVA
nr:hypothetical protein [Tanacetum cinerariifolium]